jgi:hypothetical protein
MKNWIKNILLILLLTFSIKVKGQNSITIYNNNYNTWNISNTTCSGCGSFYAMIVNTSIPDKSGLYYYDIYLWSNSFYQTGYASSSYVKNIQVFTIDPSGKETLVLKMDYALVPAKSEYFNGNFFLAYVYSGSAMQTIELTWSDINVW